VKKKTITRQHIEENIDLFGLHVAHGRVTTLLRQHLADRPELLPCIEALEDINRRMLADLIEPRNKATTAKARQTSEASKAKTASLPVDAGELFRILLKRADEQKEKGLDPAANGWRKYLAGRMGWDVRTITKHLHLYGKTVDDLIQYLRDQRVK
jgi:hypothetical protein